jgi:hypothetical protein
MGAAAMPIAFAASSIFSAISAKKASKVPEPPAAPEPADKEDAKTKERLKAMQADTALSVRRQQARTAANRQTTQLTDKLGLTTAGASTDATKLKLG